MVVETYNGTPCRLFGHTLRYKAGGACVECNIQKGREQYSPEKKRGYDLKQKYGLTFEDFNKLLAKQDYKCAICSVESWAASKGQLHIDHNHRTGKIRGLLCSKCNTAVGLCDDDPIRLEKAAEYLRKHGG